MVEWKVDIGMILMLGIVGFVIYMFATGKWKFPSFNGLFGGIGAAPPEVPLPKVSPAPGEPATIPTLDPARIISSAIWGAVVPPEPPRPPQVTAPIYTPEQYDAYLNPPTPSEVANMSPLRQATLPPQFIPYRQYELTPRMARTGQPVQYV